MRRKCSHFWEETLRTFNPPPSREITLRHSTQDERDRLLYGFTNIVLRCEKCKIVHTVSFTGKG